MKQTKQAQPDAFEQTKGKGKKQPYNPCYAYTSDRAKTIKIYDFDPNCKM